MHLSKKEQTLQELLRAAKEIILVNGHESVTVRRLAEKTGLAYTGLYYYFKDLNALLWTLRLDMIEDMVTELTAIDLVQEDPVAELMAGFFAYTEYFFQHPTVFRFFYFCQFSQPEGDERYLRLQARMGELWQRSFARLVQAGQVLPDDIEHLARTIIYALQGMITLSFSANGLLTQATILSELDRLVHYLIKK
ncbi:MAG: TetR/AcrR family transcriptional regulator [Clostridia bacterium]|nr:TetR/AcrR family transcriptional regulator [Clostridia bacterium]